MLRGLTDGNAANIRGVTISFAQDSSTKNDAPETISSANISPKENEFSSQTPEHDDKCSAQTSTSEKNEDSRDEKHQEYYNKKLAEYTQKRESLRQQLRAGKLDERILAVPLERKARPPFMMMNVGGNDMMDNDLSEMFNRFMPRKTEFREMTVKEAKKILLEKESHALINEEKINAAAVELAQNTGIIFIDEIDKIVAAQQTNNADVSRQGVQRDLLPLVEGTTVQTRYGYVKTDHILFIAAGAFHRNKPNDLMPELQGRFPIRVELKDLTQEDFERILTEPKNSLLKQYEALLKTENVHVDFQQDAIKELAAYAWKLNQTSQNIGARRLYTIMERLLEELSFEAPDMGYSHVTINAGFVKQRLESVLQDEDLSQYIL
ncbi:MAG: ATP-dependent protease ATPase subunit HslU [Planctomycetia bacterium]|nr:ATP-dependent protease ATPase subunit HslU [Planctomycetia bacterium]